MEATITRTTRAWNGVEFPVAGTWAIDPDHSRIEFTIKHLMVAKVKGRFASFAGALEIADEPTDSTTTITIAAASIDTGAPQRDEHLRSPDFFDAGQYDSLIFAATRFEHAGGSDWKLYGDLTIRDVTRPVVLDTEYNGNNVDPWGGQRAFFSAAMKLDREEWGLTWNQALETGGWLVGKDLRVEIEVEAVLQS